MPDEIFGKAVGVTRADLRLIDEVWADVSRRNRRRLRTWRLLNRLRALPIVRVLSRFRR